MSRFLDEMSVASRERVKAAAAREPLAALRRRAADAAVPPALQLADCFDLFGEVKLRSPALGTLGSERDGLARRALSYARGGAAAVSVLTEPSRFNGRLEHLADVATALASRGVPAMRKDFLVDPYQIHEARAAGAGGVLLIVRMLSRLQLAEMLEVAHTLAMFVLLEVFDAKDIDALPDMAASRARRPQLLIGVNCRDLQTLEVRPDRFDEVAASLPAGLLRVAESGVETPADCARLRAAGYDAALVGGALMKSADPGTLVAAMLAAGRGSMSLLVKICGLSTPGAVTAAAEAGADAVGFVFHASSPRNIKPERAARLAAGLPAGVLRVAVTRHPSPALVASVLAEFSPDVWQSDAEDFEGMALPAAIGRWPVLRAAPGPRPLPVRLLFEGVQSGAGLRADWLQAAALARRTELILGGGLAADNVAAAITTVRPFGVDVSSGVEREPGIKDPQRIRAFIAAARGATA